MSDFKVHEDQGPFFYHVSGNYVELSGDIRNFYINLETNKKISYLSDYTAVKNHINSLMLKQKILVNADQRMTICELHQYAGHVRPEDSEFKITVIS